MSDSPSTSTQPRVLPKYAELFNTPPPAHPQPPRDRPSFGFGSGAASRHWTPAGANTTVPADYFRRPKSS
jgi:hypothetical protein